MRGLRARGGLRIALPTKDGGAVGLEVDRGGDGEERR